jgi:hypothetical protein
MPIVGAPSTSVQVILDPVSEDATNVELVIGEGTNYGLVAHAYPAPPLRAQWASSVSTEGALLSSSGHENRTIPLTVDVTGLGALYDLEQKLGKLYREGGTIKRIDSDGREIVFDVEIMDAYEPTFDEKHHFADVTTVTFSLVCAPYGRGDEITLADHVETTLPWLLVVEADIPGDMPALGRLVVDNDSAFSANLAVWGVQSRYYSADATAALAYQAESCVLLSGALAAGAAGASGSGNNVVRHTNLNNPADPNYTTDGYIGLHYIGGAIRQTHTGRFRVLARVYAPTANAGAVSVRCAWRRYSGAPIARNSPAVLTDSTGAAIENVFVIADLGQITIPPAKQGNHAWTGWLEATGTLGDDVDIDWIMLLPCDEGYGESHLITADTAAGIVIFPGYRFQVASDSVQREEDVNYWGDAPFEGSYLLIPPSGTEGRSTRIIFKLSRAGQLVGPGRSRTTIAKYTDTTATLAVSAVLSVTPRYLVIPEA